MLLLDDRLSITHLQLLAAEECRKCHIHAGDLKSFSGNHLLSRFKRELDKGCTTHRPKFASLMLGIYQNLCPPDICHTLRSLQGISFQMTAIFVPIALFTRAGTIKTISRRFSPRPLKRIPWHSFASVKSLLPSSAHAAVIIQLWGESDMAASNPFLAVFRACNINPLENPFFC